MLSAPDPQTLQGQSQDTPGIPVPFVDLAAQYRTIQLEIEPAIQRALSSFDFILGAQLQEFEEAFAQFVGVRYAVGVGSGLDALRLALMALDVGPGDEVIVPANACIAAAMAVSAIGARTVLVDCDPATYQIDVAGIEPSITPRTRAIIPVHLTGQASDMDPILEIARRHGISIVEDAAQAHGALYKNRPCGSMGVLGCFSFYPSKNLGAYGDGGMVTAHDPSLADRLRRLRNYGQRSKSDHTECGINTRLDTLQAAILHVKLRHLRQWNEARARHAEKYRESLSGLGNLVFPKRAPSSTHVYHLFVIETKERDRLRRYLAAQGIQTGIHYPKPIHLQGAYRTLGYREGDFPQSERLSKSVLSLPMFPELTDEQIQRVAEKVRCFFEKLPSSF